jgi:hypothetical protein
MGGSRCETSEWRASPPTRSAVARATAKIHKVCSCCLYHNRPHNLCMVFLLAPGRCDDLKTKRCVQEDAHMARRTQSAEHAAPRGLTVGRWPQTLRSRTEQRSDDSRRALPGCGDPKRRYAHSIGAASPTPQNLCRPFLALASLLSHRERTFKHGTYISVNMFAIFADSTEPFSGQRVPGPQ